MNYKNRLQENNTGLQDILEKAQALPKATELPTLDNPATAADIASGYEAIGGDGVKMVGAVPEYNDGDIFYNRDTVDFAEENGVRYLVGIPQESALIRPNSVVFSEVPTSWLGDAQPEDVAAGKMFSSSAGFRLVGTAQVGGGAATVTRTVRFSYFTVDESTPAWEISYFIGGDGLWEDWIGEPSWCNAVDGEEIQMSSGQVLFIRCDGIGGYSYYCDISGGCRGVTPGYGGYAVLVVDPDNEADITITSMYAP